MIVRDGRNRCDVEHVPAWVADRLAVERFGVLAHGCFPRVGIIGIDPRQIDRHLPQQVLELVDRASVEGRRRHDVVARLKQREERGGLRRNAAGKRDCTAATFEIGDALLEDGDRRVHDPRIRVPIFLEVEISRRRFRIFEDITRRLVDRHRASTGVRVRTLSGDAAVAFQIQTCAILPLSSPTSVGQP